MINISTIDHVNPMVSSLFASMEYYSRVFNLKFSVREDTSSSDRLAWYQGDRPGMI